MRILVCGSHIKADRALIRRTLDSHYNANLVIVHGDAAGVDREAGAWARSKCVARIEVPAQWDLHGKAAGPIRNARMLKEFKPDLVLGFPGGAGTNDMCRKAYDAGLSVHRIAADGTLTITNKADKADNAYRIGFD